jgi:hypothetical protein
MGNIRNKMIRITGKLFDKRRRLVSVPNTSLILLATDGRTQTYKELKVYTKGFISRTSRMRNGSFVEIAEAEDITDIMARTSAIALNGQIFAVNEGDIVPPNDTRFTWTIDASAKNEKYP